MNKYNANRTEKRDLILLPLFFLVVVFCMVVAMRGDDNYFCDIDKVLVQEGDTLSGLAVRWCHGDTLKVTDDLVAKYGQVIQVGQEIRFHG